jgi:hypothetical protein
MGVIVKFPPPRMPHMQERIRRIRERYTADRPEDRIAEIDERLRTIDNAIAGLRSNRRAVLAERRAELRRIQMAECCRHQESRE